MMHLNGTPLTKINPISVEIYYKLSVDFCKCTHTLWLMTADDSLKCICSRICIIVIRTRGSYMTMKLHCSKHSGQWQTCQDRTRFQLRS